MCVFFNAIADAFNYIRLGKANIIVAGGAEATLSSRRSRRFQRHECIVYIAMTTLTHASRPFSASRDGFVMGEGAGCLILEELEHAKARGAKIYAELAGTGASGDAYHLTALILKAWVRNWLCKRLEDAGNRKISTISTYTELLLQ